MTVSGCHMSVGDFTMVVSCNCVLLRVGVLSEIVEMCRLMVMMGGSMMVSGRLMVMLTRRMFPPKVTNGGTIVNGRLCSDFTPRGVSRL